MRRLHHWAATLAIGFGLVGIGGCTTPGLLLGAAGVATDSSMTWEIVKHLHRQATDGDPTPCMMLDSVERALTPRCAPFVAGSIQVADMSSTRLGECPLTIASRDPRLWPVLPELIAKGASAGACAQPPAVALAQANDCPDLSGASLDEQRSLAWLAETDARAVQHDVVRWLSCPGSRSAGLDRVLDGWLVKGSLQPGTLSFSPLAALHPSDIASPFSLALEARGFTAADAMGGYVGQRASGFEEALRTSDWAALQWWFARLPQLANEVPPREGSQLAWLPLARVLLPNFLAYPDSRADMVGFLIANGADPRQKLPSDPGLTVIGYARALKSPLAGMLASAGAAEPAGRAAPSTMLANVSATAGALKLNGQ
jgi:hypothetical protein